MKVVTDAHWDKVLGLRVKHEDINQGCFPLIAVAVVFLVLSFAVFDLRDRVRKLEAQRTAVVQTQEEPADGTE